MKITGHYTFESAHRLRDAGCSDAENEQLFGPCGTIHGHTYRLEVTLQGDRLEHGMFINFSTVDEIVRSRVIARLDHRMIDDESYFQDHPSTAEEVAKWVWAQIEPAFEATTQAKLLEVKVFEGEHFSASVGREDMHPG